jgi:manganese transport protein
VIAIGVNPTQALILSQVVLSMALPVPVIALTVFTRRRALMGDLVNSPVTTLITVACSAVILCLNAVLLWETLKP